MHFNPSSRGVIWNRRSKICPMDIQSTAKDPLRQISINLSVVGCALFPDLYGLNALLVELDELSSGVTSILKSDNGKLLRIAILYLVTWVSRGTWVIVT